MTVSDKLFKWVEQNINSDPSVLRLKYAGKTGDIDYSEAILQIECRKRFGRKLSDTLAAFPYFYFPSTLSGEQASSDILAQYHASLVPENASVVDLTTGLGVDALHMARRASSLTAVERSESLVSAMRYNAEGLMLDNIEPVCSDCVDYIDSCIASGKYFDLAFIDPARRASDGGRLFALADCSPDVVALLPKISQICRMLVIKASPMLDISHTIAALGIRPVSVAATGTATECKELVITISFGNRELSQTQIEAVTLGTAGSAVFSFLSSQEAEAEPIATTPAIKIGDYIYEPYPSLMKCGAFKILAHSFGLRGFHDNTKLLFSSESTEIFPGVLWRVIEILPYASFVIKRFKSKYPAISIVARNFGISADDLRRRLGVKEAPGDMRLFAITDASGNRQLIVTSKF